MTSVQRRILIVAVGAAIAVVQLAFLPDDDGSSAVSFGIAAGLVFAGVKDFVLPLEPIPLRRTERLVLKLLMAIVLTVGAISVASFLWSVLF